MQDFYPKTSANAGFLSIVDGFLGIDTFTSRRELLGSTFPNNNWENTCALRISTMLNRVSDHRIKSVFKNDYNVIINGVIDKNQRSYKGKDNNIYIPGTMCMGAYLSWVYGRPDYYILKDKRISSNIIPTKLKKIDGNKGILLHLRMGYGGGHIDLWDGKQCYGNQTTYFGTSLELYYWKLPD